MLKGGRVLVVPCWAGWVGWLNGIILCTVLYYYCCCYYIDLPVGYEPTCPT